MVEPTADPLDVARDLLALPTAPLAEDLPAAHVAAFAAARPRLRAHRDGAGNVLVRYDGPEADPAHPLVLVAHLDHPGFAVDRVAGGRATLTFRGGLHAAAATPGSPVAFFRPGQRQPDGRGSVATVTERDGRLTGATADVDDGDAAPGGYAMWGFTPVAVDDGRITARVCDDLLGAAAALCALDAVAAAAPASSSVWGLFTRAEEIGFLGALEAIRLGTVPPGAAVLSLECSQALPGAPQGSGVIVRVGDRLSVFDQGLTAALQAAAESAAAATGLRWQRRLMDGGACEASAFCAAGFRASGLALPLGNYHNAADDGGGVGPEHVLVDDYLAEIALLGRLACDPSLLAVAAEPPAWFTERAAEARRLLSEAPGDVA